ncbi:hypothetical protein [Nocardiopsis sp. ATB16-24]|uniref:hypothetical protein n=1 Tax=Nocardiopsis sp. ATB16-24 TaxID=3019555 RepID=UPI0025522421|nr:hypothetical protein [Nocardiopsis sp. ATB16-24]
MTDQGRSRMSAGTRRPVAGACLLGGLLVLGALLGPLWWSVAPRAEGTALGEGEVFTGTTEAVFAGEGYFALMTALLGLLTGYTAYMVQFPLAARRLQDLRMVFLLAGFLGSLGGATLAWRIGVALDGPAHAAVAAAEPGTTVQTGLQLDATAFLLIWPMVFVLQYGLLDAISLLRRDQPGLPPPEDKGTDTPPAEEVGPGADRAPGRVQEPPSGPGEGGTVDRDRARPEDPSS